MHCHYEVLGITRDASDEDIKKSYRKLALQWHPDKNPEKTEECTKRFLLIQQAYEVLIDPHERAWYDKHREAIIRGGLGNGDEYQDKSLDLYQFFNASCFSGYGDDENGFYSVYAQVFKTIAAEDGEYLDLANGDTLAPEFGNSQSTYEDTVGPFYAFWSSYCTAKSYVWAEKYDTREAPNRDVRRCMEQENKKLRSKAKKERNEEVKELVSFVRKRDKRVQAYKKKLEERAAEIAQLAEQKKQRDQQQRLKVLENYKESSWSSMSALEKDLKMLEVNVAKEFGEEQSDDEDSEGMIAENGKEEECNEVKVQEDMDLNSDDEMLMDDSLYCIACNKDFKSSKALENHKHSKKHRENMEFLRQEMIDDEDAGNSGNGLDGGDDVCLAEEDEDKEEQKMKIPKTENSKSKKAKKKRKQQQKLQSMMEGNTEEEEEILSESVDSKRISEEIETPEKCEVVTECAEDNIANIGAAASEEKSSKEESICETKKKSKKNDTKQKENDTNQQPTLICNMCHKTFRSRNKLFEHIQATGHAIQLPDGNKDIQREKGGSNKNKKKSRKA